MKLCGGFSVATYKPKIHPAVVSHFERINGPGFINAKSHPHLPRDFAMQISNKYCCSFLRPILSIFSGVVCCANYPIKRL